MKTTLTVKDNDFERIIKTVRQESEKIRQEREMALREREEREYNSKTNQDRSRKITKEIKSVFRFAIMVLESHPDRPLSLEEFEVIKEELDQRASKETKRISYYFWRAIGLQTDWGIYKKFGNFHRTRSPFATKFLSRPLFFFSGDGFKDFDPSFGVDAQDPLHNYYPLNLAELRKQIFKKRYPQAEKRNPDAL